MARFLDGPPAGASRAVVTLLMLAALLQNCAGACGVLEWAGELEPRRCSPTVLARELREWAGDAMPALEPSE